MASMIDKLEIVLALAQERHFGRAADACGITQPSLSAALRSLEDTLGVLIVKRSSRFLGFTPEGERVLEWARRIVADGRAMRQDLKAMKRGLSGVLRLAVVPTALPVVAQLTLPFREHHPGVAFTVLSRSSNEVLRMLGGLEIDAGVTYLDNEPLGQARSFALYRERYCLLAARDGALAQRRSVTWAEVGREPLCLLTPDMQNRRIVEALLRAAGAEPTPSLESNSTIALLAHVRTGRWSTVLPSMMVEGLGLPDPVTAVPIEGDDPGHAVGLVVPHREPGSPLVTALIAEARGLAARLATEGR